LMACCSTREREDGGEDKGFLSWLSGGTAETTNGKQENSFPGADDKDGVHSEQRSKATILKHYAATGGKPNVLVYSINNVRPEKRKSRVGFLRRTSSGASTSANPTSPKGEPRQQEAIHVPGNGMDGVDIETDYFIGKALFMYRGKDAVGPHVGYFQSKKRNWEVRVQGRFKRRPAGDMFVGIVLRDFNYDQPIAGHSQMLASTGMAMLRKLNYDLYLSWGDRCDAARKPNAEMSHLVSNCTAWDQIIRTPKGRRPPDLTAELQELGDEYGYNLMRNKMRLSSYTDAVDEVFRDIKTEDIYTMSFWGVSQVIDLLDWNFRIGPWPISMGRFFEDSPIHVAMYEYEGPAANSSDIEDDGNIRRRHLESDKRYYLDFMFWSNKVKCPTLPKRYIFRDAAEELEKFSAGLNGPEALAAVSGGVDLSKFEAPVENNSNEGDRSNSSRDPRRSHSPAPELSRWEKVKLTLRWIPEHTCASNSNKRRPSHESPETPK